MVLRAIVAQKLALGDGEACPGVMGSTTRFGIEGLRCSGRASGLRPQPCALLSPDDRLPSRDSLSVPDGHAYKRGAMCDP